MRTVRNQKHQSNSPRLFYIDVVQAQKRYIAWANRCFVQQTTPPTVSYKRPRRYDPTDLDFTVQTEFLG